MRNAGFAEMIDFSRPGSATYVDADGVIRVAAANVLCFDYTNGRRQLMLEGPATGLGGAETNPRIWDRIGPTTREDAGTTFGDLVNGVVIGSGGQAWHGIRRAITANYAPGTKFALSAIVEAGSSGNLFFRLGLDNGDVIGFTLDLSTGAQNTYSTSGGTYGNVVRTPLAGGAILVSAVMTINAAMTSVLFDVGPGSSVEGETVIIFAAQIEAAEYASSLVYNDASGSVTRPADNAQLTESVAALLRRDEVSILVQGQNIHRPYNTIVNIVGASGDNRVVTTPGIDAKIGLGGNGVNFLSVADVGFPLPAFGFAAGFTPDGKAGSYNGSGVVANDIPLDADLSTIWLGRGSRARFASGWYDQLVIWPFRMTDADLQAKAVPYA